MTDVTSFRNEYAFLSNFHPATVTHDGIRYPTAENAYQAAKSLAMETRRAMVDLQPGAAKRRGRDLYLRPSWNTDRVLTMFHVVNDKFGDATLWEALTATRGRQLIEGNTWGDRFWGQVDGVGETMLGRILMYIRDRPPVVITCGGRFFQDAARVDAVLSRIPRPFVLRHGAAKGADSLAGAWATANGIFVEPYPAPWDLYERDRKGANPAGPIRNHAMSRGPRPALCVAFPGGKGTANMRAICERAGIPVQEG